VETFGEKESRHTQGLVPGIRDAVHLEDVLKQDIEDPCIVIVMVMCTTTLDFSNVLFYRLALRLYQVCHVEYGTVFKYILL